MPPAPMWPCNSNVQPGNFRFALSAFRRPVMEDAGESTMRRHRESLSPSLLLKLVDQSQDDSFLKSDQARVSQFEESQPVHRRYSFRTGRLLGRASRRVCRANYVVVVF